MHGTRFIAQLVFRQAYAQPVRTCLTCLAIMASSAAVTWVVSGYDALVANFDENARQFLGRYDLVIIPANLPLGEIAPLPDELIASIRRDPGVREVNPVAQSRATVTLDGKSSRDATAIDLLVGSKAPVNGAPPLDPTLVATQAEEEPYELIEGRWLSPDGSAREGVLSASAAERLGIKVDSDIVVTTISNRLRIKVVGIVQQPADEPNLEPAVVSPAAAASSQAPPEQHAAATEASRQSIGMPAGVVNSPAIEALYVRVSVADELNGYPAKVNLLQVALRDGVTSADFRSVWEARLANASPQLISLDFQAVSSRMSGSYSVSTELAQAYSATALATIAAVFIIFTTLSMEVTERAKQIALLRAIALSRVQVVTMIVFESLLMALVGWVGGLIAGQMILWLAQSARPEFFAKDTRLGWTCVWLTGVSVLVGALAAAILPAWQAARIRPLDAIADESLVDGRRFTWICAICGLTLLLVAPLFVFLLPVADAVRVQIYAVAVYPALMIGIVLLAPGCVAVCRKHAGPLVARCLRLPTSLLDSQLHSNVFRTLGATLALTSGLALFASTQIWGRTMLQYYIPGDWLPDAIVAFHPLGLDSDELPLVEQVAGIQSVLPLAVEQARFAWPEHDAPANLRRDNAVIIGLDVERAFGGDDPFLKLDFNQGRREELIDELLSGNKCIVSEEFTSLTGLSVGDRIPFSPPNAPQQTIQYEIAGVVAMPGWQWVTKFSGVRRNFVRTFTMVLADASRVRSDFHLTRSEFFWMNFDGTRPIDAVESLLQTVAERHAGGQFTAGEYGVVTAHRPFARVTSTDKVREAISMVASEVIWGMSRLPLITLAITSLAVANTIVASVRARRWQLGVLRAVGITRSQILRLVLAEAAMIALVALLLSLVFGVIAGWCGVGMSRYSGMFYSPSNLHFPWKALGLGAAGTLVLSLVAALWPAIIISRKQPLELLHSAD